jgi:hypothetical protein
MNDVIQTTSIFCQMTEVFLGQAGLQFEEVLGGASLRRDERCA